MTYEELLKHADSTGVIVKEKSIPGYSGRIYKNRIAIRNGIETQAEKSCVLAEELGHYFTSYGDIMNQGEAVNRKQEYRARLYGYNLRIGLQGLIRAYEYGCQSKHDISDYLNVSEKYLQDAIDCYSRKYGLYTCVDNYIIYFAPNLGVMKLN
ncbi:MAG: hypothetical protein PHQ72_14245 [Hespellia sp.]|nr:hypothetical protein [Hespellia sp.]